MGKKEKATVIAIALSLAFGGISLFWQVGEYAMSTTPLLNIFYLTQSTTRSNATYNSSGWTYGGNPYDAKVDITFMVIVSNTGLVAAIQQSMSSSVTGVTVLDYYIRSTDLANVFEQESVVSIEIVVVVLTNDSKPPSVTADLTINVINPYPDIFGLPQSLSPLSISARSYTVFGS